jgi:serine protease Do
MQATRRATVIGLGLAPAALFARPAQAMPDSFAPLVRKVAPMIVGIAVTQFDRLQQRPVLPRRPRLNDGSPKTGYGHKNRAEGNQPSVAIPDQLELRAAGSGFIIGAAGLIVTNNHVVGNAERIIVTLENGQRLIAAVIGADQLTDLAVIKIGAGRNLPYARWGDSAVMQVGDWVLAAGNPFDLGPSFTAGIVSARGRELGDGPFDQFLQLDAPINPGNSGGPAFNMNGEVIGVNTAIVSPSGGSVGIGFAIPSDTAAPIINALIRFGAIPRGWLGVVIGDLPAGLEGVAITGVEAQSPAARANLEPGDVIRAVNNLRVDDAADLVRAIASVPPGTVEHLTVIRKQQVFTLPVVVGRRPVELGSH